MNKQAIALLSLGHFLIDFCQGVVPALVPFLVIERHFSYAMAASLVFAISATSSIVQPLFGQLADRVGVWWLLPGSILLAGVSLALGTQAQSYPWSWRPWGFPDWEWRHSTRRRPAKAHLASGDRRTTGMSYFSVGGGLGFALAPVITTAVAVSWGMKGLVALVAPTGLVAFLIARSMSAAGKPIAFLRERAELRRRRRLAGIRNPLRCDRLPLDRLLRPQYVPGALLHDSLGANRGGGEPGPGDLPRDEHRRHAHRRLPGRPAGTAKSAPHRDSRAGWSSWRSSW